MGPLIVMGLVSFGYLVAWAGANNASLYDGWRCQPGGKTGGQQGQQGPFPTSGPTPRINTPTGPLCVYTIGGQTVFGPCDGPGAAALGALRNASNSVLNGLIKNLPGGGGSGGGAYGRQASGFGPQPVWWVR